MDSFPPDVAAQISRRLLAELGDHAENEEALKLERIEHCTRVLCQQISAIEVIEAHNVRQAETSAKKEYTNYEDLPPLRPEERDRLKEQFIDLFDRAGNQEPKDDSPPIPPPPRKRH